MLILHILLALWLILILDTALTCLLAKIFSIKIREVTLGWGPTLHQSSIFKLKPLPSGVSVQLKDSREENCEDTTDAFNHQSIWKQLTVTLLPVLFTLCIGSVLFGKQAFQTFYITFYQIFSGILGPFSTAQDYLNSFITFSKRHPPLELYGLIFIKVSAFNLLPLPMERGWFAIMQLTSLGRPHVVWQYPLTQIAALIHILLGIIWLIAIIYWNL